MCGLIGKSWKNKEGRKRVGKRDVGSKAKGGELSTKSAASPNPNEFRGRDEVP